MVDQSGKGTWILLLSIIVVILALVVVIVVVNKCCDDGTTPVGSEPEVELTLEDAHSGVWMPFDTVWTKQSKTKWTQWDGIVIQLGKFFSYDTDGKKVYKFESSSIRFEGQSGPPVELIKGSYDWINIISEHPATWEPPLTKEEGYALFPNSITPTLCDVVDTCPDLVNLPDPPAADCSADLTKVPQPCLRMRSFHATFEPYAMVTYWQGEGGYEMKAQDNAYGHNSFVFSWPKGIASVEVYLAGNHVADKEAAIAALGKINKITLTVPSDMPHGDMDDPPMTFSTKPSASGGG